MILFRPLLEGISRITRIDLLVDSVEKQVHVQKTPVASRRSGAKVNG